MTLILMLRSSLDRFDSLWNVSSYLLQRLLSLPLTLVCAEHLRGKALERVMMLMLNRNELREQAPTVCIAGNAVDTRTPFAGLLVLLVGLLGLLTTSLWLVEDLGSLLLRRRDCGDESESRSRALAALETIEIIEHLFKGELICLVFVLNKELLVGGLDSQ